MINVDKLNETINDLEEQSKNIKSVSEFYGELAKVAEEVAVTSSKQQDAAESFIQLESSLLQLRDDNKNSLEGIENLKKQINKDIENANLELLNGVRLISTENSKLYLEIQKYIDSKNELLKSDFKLELRNLEERIEKNTLEQLYKTKETLNNINETLINISKATDKKFNIAFGLIVVSIIIGLIKILI